jgi:membrane protease YdiL (CAAX protease family)
MRRYLEAAAFVFAWMAAGWLFRLGAHAYLLLGVPLTAGFQLGVRRKPLADAWVRGAAALPVSRAGLARVVVAAVIAVLILRRVRPGVGWAESLWWVACVFGALPAWFSASRLDRAKLWEAGLCLATAGVLGCGWFLGFFLLAHGHPRLSLSSVEAFVLNLLSLFLVCFVLEEVTFRGVLDSHLAAAGTKGGWGSAVFVSALWGLWHLPLTGAAGAAALLRTAALLVAFQTLVGVPLSLFWRRSGNLAVPAFTHAFIDAFRNVLFRV